MCQSAHAEVQAPRVWHGNWPQRSDGHVSWSCRVPQLRGATEGHLSFPVRRLRPPSSTNTHLTPTLPLPLATPPFPPSSVPPSPALPLPLPSLLTSVQLLNCTSRPVRGREDHSLPAEKSLDTGLYPCLGLANPPTQRKHIRHACICTHIHTTCVQTRHEPSTLCLGLGFPRSKPRGEVSRSGSLFGR